MNKSFAVNESLSMTMTRYFRQTIIDSERLYPDDEHICQTLGLKSSLSSHKNYDFILINIHDWQQGRIDHLTTDKIFTAFDKRYPEQKKSSTIELLFFPVIYLRQTMSKAIAQLPKTLMPLSLFAKLNREEKGLLTPSATAPWIPRIWLAPNLNHHLVIGEQSKLDDFLSLHSYDTVKNWSDLLAYCAAMLAWVTNCEHSTGNTHQQTNSWQTNYCLSLSQLVMIDGPNKSAKNNMLKVLDSILEGEMPSLLYKNYTSLSSIALKSCPDLSASFSNSAHHLGQITAKFPLTPYQRHALHYFLQQKVGSILAINGPPGTGKTTLLGNIVADMWVKAALLEQEPPLILATSNNNQALINILAGFIDINEVGIEKSLRDRWLPGILNYGLYFCAQAKAGIDNNFSYHAPDGSGLMSSLQTEEYLVTASRYFLAKARLWTGREELAISHVQYALHQALKRIFDDIKAITQWVITYDTAKLSVTTLYGSYEAAVDKINELTYALRINQQYLTQLNKDLQDFLTHWQARTWWQKKCSKLRWIKKINNRHNQRLLALKSLLLIKNDDADIQAYYQWHITHSMLKKNQLKSELAALKKLQQTIVTHEQLIDQWLYQHSDKHSKVVDKKQLILSLCDQTLRFKAFKLASHYWEARWLQETLTFVQNQDDDKKSPAKLLRKLHRFAKLTPCFVATFYTGPSAFIAVERQDNQWVDCPLFNSIDLLLVDEAGQALANMASPLFALAKRALIVGDTQQIEPVWTLPASVDNALLKHYHLLRHTDDYIQFWLTSGLLASNGNLMRVAQRRCEYQPFKALSRGLFLIEHRRCVDSIIAFCNQLVYADILKPLRGSAQVPSFWPPMGFVAVDGLSHSINGSRTNQTEATAIAKWLKQAVSLLLNYARNSNHRLRALSDADVLKQSVAIITPFASQAALIKTALHAYGLPNITTGTVHSLQGAERLVILFSSVYGSNDIKRDKFYDQTPNLLNAAVSRAQDHFLAFGHQDVFGNTPGTPSAFLRSKLTLIAAEHTEYA